MWRARSATLLSIDVLVQPIGPLTRSRARDAWPSTFAKISED
jgi:hypothetical protein